MPNETPSAEDEVAARFPEFADFVLQMESVDGSTWSEFRAAEDERAASVLMVDDAIRYMLCGGISTVEEPNGNRTRFRFTPKAWLEKRHG